MRACLLALVTMIAAATRAQEPGLFRWPAVSRDHIAFVYADQVWVVRLGEATARKLTTASGRKSHVRFSPDGTRIAFTGNLEGVAGNLYTTPVAGGPLDQVTHLPYTQVLSQWTANDELLFYTNSLSFSRIEMQLFAVASKGGLPTRLPLRYGAEGTLDNSGQRLAYTPHWQTPLTRTWKRYRGGTAQDVWMVDLRTHESTRITDWTGTDARPMWHGDTIYYVSDAGPSARLNIWSFDTRTGMRAQLTSFTEYDVQNPSIGPGRNGEGEIIFQYGTNLVLLNLLTRKTSTVVIRIRAEDRPVLSRNVDAARFITSREVSPDGNHVLIEARGDLWLASPGATPPQNLTTTSGVFEREASWSPDGTSIVYSSDATGEYELYLRSAGLSGGARQLTQFGGGFRYRPVWAPNAKHFAFTDHTGAFYLCDVASGNVAQIDRDLWGAQAPDISWSWDSRRLAYPKTEPNRLTSIWIYDLATGVPVRLTSGTYNDSLPVFARSGQRLYFVSERSFATPVFDPLASSFAYTATSVLVAAPLDDGAEVEQRAIQLPTARGRMVSLALTHDDSPIFGLVSPSGERSVRTIRGGTEVIVLEGISEFQLSHDGRKVLLTRGDQTLLIEPQARPAPESVVSTKGMTVDIDLRAEWRQLFVDLWRLYRDFFYDPTMHGVDWLAVRSKYLQLLSRAETRDDVNHVLEEMIGELSVGHAYIVNQGDVPQQPVRAVGMLGADYAYENGFYRIVRIYEGAPQDLGSRSPLRQPGNEVHEGDYLLAVKGIPVDLRRDPWAAFDGLADREVTITIGPNPALDTRARVVTVKPLANETNLRYRAWVERNRRTVAERSGGRMGYLHIPDFGVAGLAEFMRQFEWQTDKDALVIDTRWSQGGAQGATVAEILSRRPLNFAASRYSSQVWPAQRRGAHFGPKAVLANHFVHSAGENFLYYFRKLGLGTILGTRTWGGLVGLNGNPALIDNGYVNIPNAPFFDTQGWLIEGHGVDPDTVVPDDPAVDADPQLDAVIALLAAKIVEDGYLPPTRPPYKSAPVPRP